MAHINNHIFSCKTQGSLTTDKGIELQIRECIEDDSEINFLISHQKHML